MRLSHVRRPDPVLDLTPMIDIVFQLVLFFMVSTTFVDAPGIEIDLPKASAETVLTEKDDLNIWVTSDGALYLDEEPISLDALRSVLQQSSESAPDTLVIIKADAGVAHGRVVGVMDLAKSFGLHRLAIATEGEAGAQ